MIRRRSSSRKASRPGSAAVTYPNVRLRSIRREIARIGTIRLMNASSSVRGASAITSSESVILTAVELFGIAPSNSAADRRPVQVGQRSRTPARQRKRRSAAATVLLPVPPLPVTNKTRGSFIG